jgi:NAD(P)-dependent dehydrogenase (short-subunit alcohol dehydrogenase family)
VRDLRGRVALVTGGGRGLGEQICRVLAEAGAAVVAADIRPDLAEQVAKDIEAMGGRATALELDVCDAARAEEAVEQAAAWRGRLNVLVNNAGTDVTAPVEELSVDAWDRIMAVNLRAPFILSRRALPYLRETGGHIVNIVSTAAKRSWANAAAYHASKTGLLAFSHALHVEGRGQGVKVTAIIAGGMRTPFLLDRFPDIDPEVLQDPRNVAESVRFALTQPEGTVVPELMVLPMRETSWP